MLLDTVGNRLLKSGQKPATLADAKNLLRGSRDPWRALSSVRSRIAGNDLKAFVHWMPNAMGRSGSVETYRFPRRLEQFRTKNPLQSVSFTQELSWAVAQIMEEAQRLEHFLDLKAAYEHSLCRGASAECFTALDALEQDLGFSFWSIEARIGALQLYEGLEAQKNYLT